MPNIASVLKAEICRLAKKEVKAQVGKTRKAAAQYRRDIAKLKRLLSQQDKEIKLLKKCASSTASPSSPIRMGSMASAFPPDLSRRSVNG